MVVAVGGGNAPYSIHYILHCVASNGYCCDVDGNEIAMVYQLSHHQPMWIVGSFKGPNHVLFVDLDQCCCCCWVIDDGTAVDILCVFQWL